MKEKEKNANQFNNYSGDGAKSYWNKWYLAVLLFLILQIILFYLITVKFK